MNYCLRKSLSLSSCSWSDAEMLLDSLLLSNSSSSNSSSRKSLYSLMHNFLSKFLSFSSIIYYIDIDIDNYIPVYHHLTSFTSPMVAFLLVSLSSPRDKKPSLFLSIALNASSLIIGRLRNSSTFIFPFLFFGRCSSIANT